MSANAAIARSVGRPEQSVRGPIQRGETPLRRRRTSTTGRKQSRPLLVRAPRRTPLRSARSACATSSLDPCPTAERRRSRTPSGTITLRGRVVLVDESTDGVGAGAGVVCVARRRPRTLGVVVPCVVAGRGCALAEKPAEKSASMALTIACRMALHPLAEIVARLQPLYNFSVQGVSTRLTARRQGGGSSWAEKSRRDLAAPGDTRHITAATRDPPQRKSISDGWVAEPPIRQ